MLSKISEKKVVFVSSLCETRLRLLSGSVTTQVVFGAHIENAGYNQLISSFINDAIPPWGPGGLSRECVLRIPMRVVKGD